MIKRFILAAVFAVASVGGASAQLICTTDNGMTICTTPTTMVICTTNYGVLICT